MAEESRVGGLLLSLDPPSPFIPEEIISGEGSTLSVDERVSVLLESILPDYVSQDHEKFVAFLRAYFEWSEQHGNPRAEAVRINTYTDIDQKINTFTDFFKSQYLFGFPSELISGVDTENAIKLIRDYYQQKGSPRSLDFLFRLLFNSPATVSYPRDLLLTLSDSDRVKEDFVIVSRNSNIKTIQDTVGGQIKQRLSGANSTVIASAFIEDIDNRFENNIAFSTIKIRDKVGSLLADKVTELTNGLTTAFETSLPLVSGITIENGGRNFTVGQAIVIKDSRGRIVGSSEILSVGKSGATEGIINRVEQVNPRTIFNKGETYSFEIQSASGTGATLGLLGNLSNSTSPYIYNTDRSLISSLSRIQDNNKFQQYSYVVDSEQTIENFAEILKQVFHPAGSKLFSTHRLKRTFSATTFDRKAPQVLKTSENPLRMKPIIGNFTPYTFNTTFDFRGDTFGSTFIDYYPTGYNGLTAAVVGTSVTHDPTPAGYTPGAMGSISAGTLNPEAYGFGFGDYTAGTILPGYTVEAVDQLIMNSSDTTGATHWTIYRHPKHLMIPSETDVNAYRYQVAFFFDPFDSPVKALEASTGFRVGTTIVQRGPNKQTAIGEIVAREVVGRTDENNTFPGYAFVRGATFAEFITINILNGEFSNQPDQNGNKLKVINVDTGAERFMVGPKGGFRYFRRNARFYPDSIAKTRAMKYQFIGDFLTGMGLGATFQ